MKIAHTLEIYPDKERPPLGETYRKVQIIFKDKDTKVAYCKAENQFTLDSFNDYLTANTTNKKSAQRALDLKRVTFARQNNYIPKKGNKFTWVYTPSDGGDEPKRYA